MINATQPCVDPRAFGWSGLLASITPWFKYYCKQPLDSIVLKGKGSERGGHGQLVSATRTDGLSPTIGCPYFTFITAGGDQLPSMIEGSVIFGQYMRIIGTKSPFGVGSQFASLSVPGVSFWK